jgi:hypothetical protein
MIGWSAWQAHDLHEAERKHSDRIRAEVDAA